MTSFKFVLAAAALLASSQAFAESFNRGTDVHPGGAAYYTNVSSENATARYKEQVFYPEGEQFSQVAKSTMR